MLYGIPFACATLVKFLNLLSPDLLIQILSEEKMFPPLGSESEFISRLFSAKLSGTGSLALQPERYGENLLTFISAWCCFFPLHLRAVSYMCSVPFRLLLPDLLMQNKTNMKRQVKSEAYRFIANCVHIVSGYRIYSNKRPTLN